jgi:hypothetical protein
LPTKERLEFSDGPQGTWRATAALELVIRPDPTSGKAGLKLS